MSSINRDTTSAMVDGVLKFVAAGGVLSVGIMAPNAVQAFNKPLDILFNKLDKRQRERELRRVLTYMKNRDLIKYDARRYENGIKLTSKGKKRLKRTSYNDIFIPRPQKWDGAWRLVFFDIPEKEKSRRNAFNSKLKLLGFKQLQISIWIHPFPCRSEIEAICKTIGILQYVTYVKVSDIDNQNSLKKRFESLLS